MIPFMKLEDAANILAKIGNPTRLKIVRMLVRAGVRRRDPSAATTGHLDLHHGIPVTAGPGRLPDRRVLF